MKTNMNLDLRLRNPATVVLNLLIHTETIPARNINIVEPQVTTLRTQTHDTGIQQAMLVTVRILRAQRFTREPTQEIGCQDIECKPIDDLTHKTMVPVLRISPTKVTAQEVQIYETHIRQVKPLAVQILRMRISTDEHIRCLDIDCEPIDDLTHKEASLFQRISTLEVTTLETQTYETQIWRAILEAVRILRVQRRTNGTTPGSGCRDTDCEPKGDASSAKGRDIYQSIALDKANQLT